MLYVYLLIEHRNKDILLPTVTHYIYYGMDPKRPHMHMNIAYYLHSSINIQSYMWYRDHIQIQWSMDR